MQRRRRRIVARTTGCAAAVAAGTLLVTGVAAAATGAPSHDAYIERADRICSRTTDKIDAVVEDVGLSPTDAEARAAVDQVVALTRKEIDKLRALTPPRGDAKQVDRIYDAVERAIDRVEAKPSSLFDEPSPFARAGRLADAYGFEDCGKG